MSKHTLYISNGEIHEYNCGRSAHKRHIKEVYKYAGEKVNIYFRPSLKWKLESIAYLQNWKSIHNIF